jgi:predicted AlkP superfamily pyrophosphatase or phosphodiesterase
LRKRLGVTRVLLVIMDGAGYDAVLSECGWLEGAVALGQARRWRMRTALPSLSGPMYETIHTGLWPHQHGIVSNDGMRASSSPNVFSLMRAAGKSTGAVAQSFFHQLYVGRPWDPLRSVEHLDESTNIQAARFYSMEGYGPFNACAPAEIDLCAQATLLIERYTPDYMLLHTCSADTLGHTFGGESTEYRRQIWRIDNALSRAIPEWRALGYNVIVTADHGMTADHWHGGTSPVATEVPFYLFSDAKAPAEGEELSQLGIAASVLALVGVSPADGMGDAFLSSPRASP